MRIGICLTGGGAKGAFQGGFLRALIDENIIPEVFSGTSIGAVNLYYFINGAYRELEEFWLNMELKREEIKPAWVFDNSQLINRLKNLNSINDRIRAAYVNFVCINNRGVSEEVVDVMALQREEALMAVKYSSLLPSRPEDYIVGENGALEFNSKNAFENFKADVFAGIYDGYKLDGGILNNNLLQPIINEEVDKIIIIGLSDKYSPPDYLYEKYNRENIIVVKPDIEIKPSDTIRFEKEFCIDLYNRGYKIGKKIVKESLFQS